MNKNSIGYTVVFSFSITFILVFILSLVSTTTEERVKKTQRSAQAKAYLIAVGIETEGKDIEKIFKSTFNRETPSDGAMDVKVKNIDMVVSPFSGKGLWGTITGVIAIQKDYKRIVGIEILFHTETPGLGGRIDEKWFKEQFRGELIGNGIKVIQSGGSGDDNPENSSVDGITGATRTSESIEDIVNKVIARKGGGDE